jgi:hypothetical protein
MVDRTIRQIIRSVSSPLASNTSFEMEDDSGSGKTALTDLLASMGVYNIRTHYGAVGNGSANDAPAFQAAANAGGIVIVPPGNYHFASTVIISSAVKFVGPGQRAAAITCYGTDLTLLRLSSGSGGACFYDLALEGYMNAAATQHLIVIDQNITEYLFSACRMWGGNYAIRTSGIDGCFFDCGIAGSIGHVLSDGANWWLRCKIDTVDPSMAPTYCFRQLQSFSGATSGENNFDLCDFSGTYTYSVYIDDSGQNYANTGFNQCIFSSNIYIPSARHTRFSNCEIGINAVSSNAPIAMVGCWGQVAITITGSGSKQLAGNYQIS